MYGRASVPIVRRRTYEPFARTAAADRVLVRSATGTGVGLTVAGGALEFMRLSGLSGRARDRGVSGATMDTTTTGTVDTESAETLSSAAGRSMRAIARDRYGSADVLEVREVEVPAPGDDEVLVRVRAAGLDRGTWHIMAGVPYLMRIAGYGVRTPKTAGLGTEVAGVIAAIGGQVAGLRPGDAVYGTCGASFAEYSVARADRVARLPTNLTFEQAAAVPVSGVTALQAVRDHGHVRAGQHVLVIGASGGVGTFAVQIAKALGAEVTAVCSTAKLDLMRTIGADHVIDYTRSDITDGGPRHDLVLDIGGNRPLSQLRRALNRRGTLVIVGGEGGGRWTGGIHRQVMALALSPFVRQRLGTFIAKQNSADLDALRALIETGAVTPVIDRVVTLPEIPDAIRDLASGQVRGKIVVAT